MASPSVDPPEGFILDGDNAMRRNAGAGGNAMSAGRMALGFANAWAGEGARVLGEAVTAPYHAAKRLMQGSPRTLSSDAPDYAVERDALIAGPGLLASGGLPRAAAGRAVGELGAAGSQIVKRADAQKLIRESKAAGKTDDEIAEALNERFAPLLDEGTNVTGRMVRHRREHDLGAMGGQGSTSVGKLTADDVAQMMRELGYENVAVTHPKTGNTKYVIGDPPGNPPRSNADRPMVRVPDDGHLGRPASGREVGSRLDTGTPGNRIHAPERTSRDWHNQGGEPYADPNALEAALRWRKGDLVRPDQAPARQRLSPPLELPPAPKPVGPDLHPDQLKLLASGVPAPVYLPGPSDDFSQGIPGQLIPGAGEDAISRNIIGQMADYTPGERESTNVEDRRGEPDPRGSVWHRMLSVFRDDGEYDQYTKTGPPPGFVLDSDNAMNRGRQ